MTREMHDACNPATVNRQPGVLVAGYVDGLCAAAWSGQQADVWISSIQTDAGVAGDCEPRNGTVAGWVQWVGRRRATGVDPTLYVAHDSLGSFFDGFHWSEVRAAFAAAGVAEPHWWVALPGAQSIPAGAVAVQNALNVPPGFDQSLAADYWPGVDSGGEMFHGAQDFDDIANQIQGIGGTPNPSLSYFQALLQTVQGDYNLAAAAKAEIDAMKAEIDAAGGNPSDAAVLQALQRIETALKSA